MKVVVDMGNDEYLMAPITKDDLKVRLLNPLYGALIVFRPRMFARFKIKKEEV